MKASEEQQDSLNGWGEPNTFDANAYSTRVTALPPEFEDYLPNAEINLLELCRDSNNNNICTTLPDCVDYVPSQVFCSADGDCPNGECGSDDYCAGYCADWENHDVETNPISGTPPTAPTDVSEENAVEASEAQRQSVSCDAAMQNVPGAMTVAEGKRATPGVALGFRGFSSSLGIGSFRTVCGPWEQMSYTENWRWLEVRGPVSSADRAFKSYGIGHFPWQKKLHRAVRREYYRETLEDPEAEIERTIKRPLPMKLCPPNTALHGVKVLRDGELFRRLTHLICTPTNSSVSGSDRTVSLVEDVDYGYQMSGTDYDLSQEIGLGEGESATIDCSKEGEVVNKVVTEHDSNGHLTGLWFRCQVNPS